MLDIQDTTRSDLRHAVISGIVGAVIAVPIATVALDWYVAMTVSVMTDPQLFTTLLEGAQWAVGYAAFFSGFFGSFFARRDIRKQ